MNYIYNHSHSDQEASHSSFYEIDSINRPESESEFGFKVLKISNEEQKET